MIQKKFLCEDLKTAEETIPQISRILSETPHKAALITFYEKGFSTGEVEALVKQIKDSNEPGLLIAGISITIIAELMPSGSGILINLILTEKADIEVVTIPCIPGEEDKAAAELNDRLSASSNAGAVELFGSNMSLNITRFMEKAMEGHEEKVLFGTTTIRNLPTRLSSENEDRIIEIEHMDQDQMLLPDEFIYGNGVLHDGFVAVIFSGDDLKVKANYALGWSPIGKKLNVELGENPSRGETVVNLINDSAAVDIYRKYLGVYPDAFLISNICEFPFIVEREGIDICLIPIDCDKDGALYFMMSLHQGEKLRLTFASHDEVLEASFDSLHEMERFQPEALFLTLCGNRINFLKEDAHVEWDSFKAAAPDYALMHGACELFYHRGRGGILNSAHLAIGFREGGIDADKKYSDPDIESFRKGRVKQLSDRMSVFLRLITSELIEAVNEARDANNAKSAFLSHMSHEIRTPINAILGMDEMILRESEEPEILNYAEDIRSAGNNLLGIVNDVLDFSKIEAGRMAIIPEEYELASIINDLYNVVRLRASNKGLSVKLDIDPSVPAKLFGDETRIRQVITNLLTNAVKYTEKGSVTLSVRKLEAGGTNDRDILLGSCPDGQCPDDTVRLLISVKDTGIGIRPEDMEKLFAEYVRIEEKRNRSIEGTGLGLNITRDLLELMGSRLLVESTYGEGSVFGFEIVQGVLEDEPVGELNGRFKKVSHSKYHVSFTAEEACILVVDDNKVNLDVIKNLLKKTKIIVDTALSGEEALKLVSEKSYDMIFLDHLMPGMDGPETLKHMMDMEDNLSIEAPVIALTANAVSGAKDQYLKAGFKDYLSKPVNSKKLEEMIFNNISSEKIRTVSENDDKKNLEETALLPSWLLECEEIDAAEGLRNCSTKEAYQIVLESFCEVIAENADEIEEYFRREDWENYTIKVHALKSSAKTIGAVSLSEQAALLEKAGMEKDVKAIENGTEKLLTQYRSLIGKLSSIV